MSLQSLTLFQLFDRLEDVSRLILENESRYYSRYSNGSGGIDYSASIQDDYNGEGAEYTKLCSERSAIVKELTDRSRQVPGGELPTKVVVPETLVASCRDLSVEYLSWLNRHPDALDSIHWEAFEKLVAEIFASSGFTVDLTGRVKNCSADIIAVRSDAFGVETKYLIECKRYDRTRPIGLDIVNGVMGAKVRAGVDHAFLVTTSSFTKNVVAQEPEFKQLRLHLRDGEEVRKWLGQYTVRPEGGLWLGSNWMDAI